MTFNCKVLSVALLTSYGAFAALNPASNPPSYCTWLAKTPILGTADPATVTCVDKCHAICEANPGEYFCYGYKAHTDTDTHIHDPDINGKFVYCVCSRSVVTRLPGTLCGPDEGCPGLVSEQSNGFTDGLDNMIPGYQGTQLIAIEEKLNATLETGNWDTDVACDNTLNSKMRYLFQKK